MKNGKLKLRNLQVQSFETVKLKVGGNSTKTQIGDWEEGYTYLGDGCYTMKFWPECEF